MKIDNLVRIVDGVLCTTPSINAFEHICFESSKINRGDLFIDTHSSYDAIAEALSNGAYAILTELQYNSSDEEIAWIKIATLSNSLIKLSRYLTTQKSLFLAIANPIQATFLNAISRDKRVKILPDTLIEIAQEICKAKENDILCLNDVTLASHICPSFHTLKNPLDIEIYPKGLFISSFSDESHHFFEVRIPSIFALDFLGALEFCKTQHIAYTIDTLGPIEHFYPQFITNNIRKKEFGMSEQVLIFEENPNLIQCELSYLQNYTSAKNLLLCLPSGTSKEDYFEGNILYYQDADDFEKLLTLDFKYALVLGKRDAFEAFLTRDFSTQLTLF